MISLFTDIACQRCASLVNEGLSENPRQREKLIALGDTNLVFEVVPVEKNFAPVDPLLSFLPATITTLRLKTIRGEIALHPLESESAHRGTTASPAESFPSTDKATEHNGTDASTVVVRANPFVLARLIFNPQKLEAEALSNLIINGDPQRLIEVLEIFRQLDLDWEARLAAIVGDLPARLFCQYLGDAKTWTADSTERMRESFKNFREEELGARDQNPLAGILDKLSALLEQGTTAPETDRPKS